MAAERTGRGGNSAVLSADGLYRYVLTRSCPTLYAARGGHVALWLMLNPSTADAATDDATIRRCLGYSRAWHCDALTVVNLYAYRATDPRVLRGLAPMAAIGPDNDYHIEAALAAHPTIALCAWGAHADETRARAVYEMIVAASCVPLCLGTTAGGQPLHPLRLRRDLLPVPFAPSWRVAA